MSDVLITRISAALADPDAPWYGSDLIEDVAEVLDRLAEVEAERDAARQTFKSLCNSVEGVFVLAMKEGLRDLVGNTNCAVVEHWLKEARDALKDPSDGEN